MPKTLTKKQKIDIRRKELWKMKKQDLLNMYIMRQGVRSKEDAKLTKEQLIENILYIDYKM